MTRVCLQCGTPYEGETDGDFVVFYADCEECGEKTFYGTRAEYEHKQQKTT